MREIDKGRPRLAGGIFIAIGLLAGAITGIAIDQPSAGMVAGLMAGSIVAGLIWLFDSKRR